MAPPHINHSSIISSAFDNQADVMLVAKPAELTAVFQRLIPVAVAVLAVPVDTIAILMVVVQLERLAVVLLADVRILPRWNAGINATQLVLYAVLQMVLALLGHLVPPADAIVVDQADQAVQTQHLLDHHQQALQGQALQVQGVYPTRSLVESQPAFLVMESVVQIVAIV